MQKIFAKKESLVKVLLTDAVLLAVICLVPALSHVTAVALYQFNPMLLCLLAGMTLVNDRRNAFLLALLLPVVSMLLTGMPTPLKAICMVGELTTLVAIWGWAEKRMPALAAILVAMLSSKIVYYGLKALIISPVALVGTSLWLQTAMALAFAAAFVLFRRLVK